MTTAHRPTYNPTKGGNSLLSNPTLQHSSRDLPANLNIKYREKGQGSLNEVKQKDFKGELIQSEMEYQFIREDLNLSKDKLSFIKQVGEPQLEEEEEVVFPQDKDVSYSEDDKQGDKKQQYDSLDSEEELLIELEKIKQHQKEEKGRKDQEIKEKTQHEILKRNPLLNRIIEEGDSNNTFSNDYSLQRKWFEDSVFKNQSKLEQKVTKRFINDTVRSDFHRKFLSKTIQ